MRKAVMIINPQSGKKKKIKNYTAFYDILRKYGYEAQLKLTERKGHATEIIQGLPDDIDLVISAGGDGTLNEVVTGNMLREKRLTLANLPMGTTNDVGNMYGLNRGVYENLELILKGRPKKLDVVYINETPFVYVACLGDYIDMAYNTPRRLKKRFGKLGYAIYAFQQIFNPINIYDIKYRVDGEEHTGKYSFIFISNSSRIAGMPDVYYDVKLDDNKFEVALANVSSKRDMLRLLMLISTIDVKDIPGVTYYQTNDFEIEFQDKLKTSWCIDGEEYIDQRPIFRFKIDKKTKMMMPREKIGELVKEED